MKEKIGMTSSAEIAVSGSTKQIPIGTLLVMEELIVPQDLFLALEYQKQSKKLLGEILINLGALERDDLDRALKLQGSVRYH